MKSYTNLEQSKKLAEILPIKSADMKWFVPADNKGEFVEKVSLIKYKYEYNLFEKVTDWDDTPYIPCWSLAALLDILPPSVRLVRTPKDSRWYCECNDGKYQWYAGSGNADNPIDTCVEVILKLHEQNLI
jgi:hypothetical protein